MEWTRHQLAPAMPGQKIVDRAVAGGMPDRLFVSGLEIVDVQHFARSRRLGKTLQQHLLGGQRHVLALASANGLRLERFDPATVERHVRAIDGAQRNPHRGRNRRLRHSALAQQYHLDALTLSRRNFPPQRRFQPSNLALRAFDHLFPRIRWSQRITPCRSMLGTQLPQKPRFNPLWNRYERSIKSVGTLAYGGMQATASKPSHWNTSAVPWKALD